MAKRAAASKRRSGSAARKPISRRRRPASVRRTTTRRRRWSQDVTEHSDALTLERGVFTSNDPKRIAASLKRSAQRSKRRKADPFRSALSMLTFYINRAGRNSPGFAQEDLDAGEGRTAKAIRQGLSAYLFEMELACGRQFGLLPPGQGSAHDPWQLLCIARRKCSSARGCSALGLAPQGRAADAGRDDGTPSSSVFSAPSFRRPSIPGAVCRSKRCGKAAAGSGRRSARDRCARAARFPARP